MRCKKCGKDTENDTWWSIKVSQKTINIRWDFRVVHFCSFDCMINWIRGLRYLPVEARQKGGMAVER